MKLTELVIKRPVSAVILIAGIIIFGFISMVSMPQELTPEMEMPMLIVSTVYPGASPEDVDKLVSKEIEGAVGSLSGIQTILSTSNENVSIVILRYSYGTNMDIAYTDLRAKLDGIESRLPDTTTSPMVMELDMNAMATMTLSLTSDSRENMLDFVEEEIVPEFEKLASVADVTVSGGREDYIKVELLPERMQQYGVTMSSIASSVSGADFSMPLGSADFGSQDLALRTEVKYNTLDSLKNIPIPLGSGAVIRLSDVANVYISAKDAKTVSRYNSSDNIGLSIQKRQSSSAVTVSREAMRVVERLRVENPDIEIAVISDTSESIESSISSVGSTLVLGVLLSMLVLFVFLGDMRASLIVGSSMPVSLLITFILMNMMGFTLNIVTLSAMVLGVGMMVDNSIVVIDSCFKFHAEERTIKEAAVEGTKFVMLSIVASTITTIVVFVPLAVIQGMSGQMFKPLGFTIVFALVASLISAITLVPLFFTRFQPKERNNALAARALKRVEDGYGNLLRKLLKKKKIIIAASIAILVVSVLLAAQINVELMPSMDEGIVSISVTTRPGLKLEQANEIMVGLEEMVAGHPEVDHYSLTVGGSGGFSGLGSLGGGSSSSLTAYLRDGRKMSTNEMIEFWRNETQLIVDCDIDIAASSSAMSLSSDTVDVKLQGSDLDSIREAAAQVSDMMKQHPDMLRVSSSLQDSVPQGEIVVDPMKAAAVGLSPAAISGNVYSALNGTETVTVRMDDKNYSIWVEYPGGKYQSVSDIANMILVVGPGASVALSDVAAIEFTNGPQTISREDNQYTVTVTGTPKAAAKFTSAKDIEASMAAMELPRGVSQGQNTTQQSMDEEFASLGMAILTAILLVFMVMAIQFESVKHSVMVMVCIPFCLIGSFSLLYLFGSTISMVSLLGFLILIGTVVNNGILFVDTTNRYRETMDVESALVETGRTRLRPILMTTLTTVLSMLPLALGIGSGAEMMQGMGVTVIGGLTASTILTLLFLPTFYLMIDGNEAKKKLRAEKRAARKEVRSGKIDQKLAKQEVTARQKTEKREAKKKEKETSQEI